jgi:FkbM family methyltransferase
MVKVIANTDPAEVGELLWLGYSRCKLGFDVGANCGQSITPMLRFCDRVVAFEPNRDAFAEMRRRYGAKDIWNIAISDHEGLVELAQLGGKQAETGQLVTPGLRGMEWEPATWEDVTRISCSCHTVDYLARHEPPGFIKVDTEGHEAQVLRGATKTLAEIRPAWLVEFHSPEGYAECVSTLRAASYKVETVRHPHYPKNSPMWHQHGWIRAFAR